MTEEEYEEKRQRLEADAEDARKDLNRARARYDEIASALRDLRLEWRDQQTAKQ
ncbi:hypothetical protein [Streptomyces sp. Ac-502]|uniref:hypothetical protein n=1 Tax=Streptomyces sp. Ac-502 TaxID=3342801 RepID=UPI00386222FF